MKQKLSMGKAEKVAGQFGFKIENLEQISGLLNDKIKIKKGEILFRKIK